MNSYPSRPLVFVVGAGASKDFGESMPIGSELAENIENQLSSEFAQGSPDGPIKKTLLRSPQGLSPADTEAATRIRRSIFAQPSIDELLNEWRDVPAMIRVGKAAIVNAILKAERDSSLGVTAKGESDAAYAAISGLRECWLAFLLKNLRSGTSRRNIKKVFEEVGFIIFNYDRCIEQYLYWAFQSVAGLDANSASDALSDIPLVHVYGDLGQISSSRRGPFDVRFGYDGVVHENTLNRIKTYTEEDHDQENLKKIHTLFKNAKRIVFLGMGYHHRNISLLLSDGQPRLDSDIWGTSLHPDQLKLQAMQQSFQPSNGSRSAARLESFPCKAFLEMNRAALLEGLS